VAERKDVLSGLLAFLALAAWTGYVRRPSPARYALFTALFALGLLAKPMLVTLPLLLLLLDVWPYRRIQGFVRERLLEKVPLLLLSAGAALVTLLAQSHARAALGGLSLAVRLSNAAIAIAQYLLQLAWPAHLSVLYPHPIGARFGLGVTCALALAALTCWTWLERRRRPWLLVGWLWFVVALVPVLGIVQVGLQARADRYTYLPTVGLLAAVVWSGVSWAERSRRHRVVAAVAVGLVALAATARTRGELRHWHDSVALFSHALEVTGPDNPMAQFGLAQALAQAGQAPEAILHFAAAVAQRPDFERALEGGAEALVRAGRVDEAADWYARLLQRQPRSASTAYNLGQLRVAQGDLDGATRLLRIATTIDPGIARARHDLGIALLLGGDADAGVEWLRQAARGRGAPAEWKTHFEEAEARRAGRPAPALARYLAESRLVLADGLARRGRRNEACAQLRAAEPEAAPDQLQRVRALRDHSCARDAA
jgi:tetratricopeptide (TPR) repeat protein